MHSLDAVHELNKVAELVQYGCEEFKPHAMFDDQMDCIRVVVRDCSIVEKRINARITLMTAAHSRGKSRFVGFTLKGAHHFCNQYGFSRVVDIKSLLQKLTLSFPGVEVEMFVELMGQLVDAARIESVEIPHGVAA